ncbi:MAG: glycosyltransferase family 39 protein [Geitlerinemataceae cyanobacterium]
MLPTVTQIGLVVVLQLAFLIRFAGLDNKPLWKDEVYSLTRAAGYRIERTIARELHQQNVVAGDLAKYLDPANTPRSWNETWVALKSKPEHPPLYFLLLRGFVSEFQSNPEARIFSVTTGAFAVVAIWSLGWTLFRRESAGWGAVMLAVASPVLLRYSQEIRHYGLWLLFGILATICLLKALDRDSNKGWWRQYGWYLTLAGATHLLTASLAIVHGAIVAISTRAAATRDRRRAWRSWLTCIAIAASIVAPWPLMALGKEDYLRKPAAYARFAETSPRELVSAWLQRSAEAVVFLPDRLPSGVALLVAAGVVTLSLASAVWLWRSGERRAVAAAGCLTLIPFLLVAVPDVLLGGARSMIPRYFLLSFVGAIVLLGGALGRVFDRANVLQRSAIAIVLAILCLSNVVGYSSRESWEPEPFRTVEFAQAIAQQSDVTLVSDAPLAELLTIAPQLPPEYPLIWIDTDRPIDLALPDTDLLIHSRDNDDLDTLIQQQLRQQLHKTTPPQKTPEDRKIFERDDYVLWKLSQSDIDETDRRLTGQP